MKEFKIDIYFSALKEDKQQELIKVLKEFNIDVEEYIKDPLATLTFEYIGDDYEGGDVIDLIEEDGWENIGPDIFRLGHRRGWRNGGNLSD